MTHVTEIALFTDDVGSLSDFYRDLIGAASVAEWAGGAIFAAGESKILVHERSASTDGGPPNEDHCALAIDDLDVTCDALRARGLELLVEPRDYTWGRSAYLRDPDGRLMELARI